MKKTKIIEITVSQTLSSIQKIEVPEDFDEKNIDALEAYAEKQIVLPSDCLETCGYFDWDVDDFCVI